VKKLIWVLIDNPTNRIVKTIQKAIEDIKLEDYHFIITPSTIRPVSIETLKAYLETLLQTLIDLEGDKLGRIKERNLRRTRNER